MPRPDFEQIAMRYAVHNATHDTTLVDHDGVLYWRASLPPDDYAEWKAEMLRAQLSRDCPGWESGSYPLVVQQKIWAEWFGDDCTVLQFLLREEGIDYEYIQIFLAKPWHAARRYIEVFGDAINQQWRANFQSLLSEQEHDVMRVTGESVENLPKGDLRAVASAFIDAVWKFRESYGKI